MKKINGFTLVELSIVLVIIGLLIGGILVAQSMIGTAKIQGVVRQLSQYDVAVTNFQTKYNQLPGDTNLFSHIGNNNGVMGDDGNGQEAGHFWQDLSLGVSLKNSLGTDYQPFTFAATTATEAVCPKFRINQDTTTQACMLPQNYDFQNNWPTINYGGAQNFYNYSETGTNNIIGGPGGVAPPIHCADALSIDLKIDDGKPYYGKVLASGCATYNLNDTVYTVSAGTNTLLIIFMGVTNSTNN